MGKLGRRGLMVGVGAWLRGSQYGSIAMAQGSTGVSYRGREVDTCFIVCPYVLGSADAAAVNIQKLAEVFGAEWVTSVVVPKLSGMGTDVNYLIRRSAIKAAEVSRRHTSIHVAWRAPASPPPCHGDHKPQHHAAQYTAPHTMPASSLITPLSPWCVCCVYFRPFLQSYLRSF